MGVYYQRTSEDAELTVFPRTGTASHVKRPLTSPA